MSKGTRVRDFNIFSQSPNKFIALMHQSVKRQVVADVKVGCFLWGGVDSSILAAVSSSYGVKDAFTISTESKFDESKFAKEVASKFKLNLHICNLRGSDFVSALREWVTINDDPISDPSALALLLLSRFARSKGIKVVLSGDGADELFGGYNAYSRYLFVTFLHWLLPHSIRNFLSRLCKPRVADYLQMPRLRFLGSAHAITFDLLNNILKDSSNPSSTAQYIEKKYQTVLKRELDVRLSSEILMRTDKATMASSIEARVPFLDDLIYNFARDLRYYHKFGFLLLGRKTIIKRAAIKLGIPRSCVYRSKIGFELPLQEWLADDLSDIVKKMIAMQSLSLFNYEYIQYLYDTLSSPSIHPLTVSTLWQWLTLELWHETRLHTTRIS